MTLADEIEAVAKRAGDALRAASASTMTVYELADAIGYVVNDEGGEERLLQQARYVFDRVLAVRSGTETPIHFERELEASQ